jgi:molecular chaperone DnaK
MSRSKIDFGIDLGTTNSSIALMEKGNIKIFKTDTLKDTMPSCVYINKKGTMYVGDKAYNGTKSDKLNSMKTWIDESNSFIEFKRTMGTDKKYHSSNANREFSSEELSSEVLKMLKSFVTNENIEAVIITVPAKFTMNQKDATMRAAKLAGFSHIELLQEPVAASMAYGLSTDQKNGFWLVFDFGGGTFDAALLKVEDGIMKVIDTDGDNYLGGKNLDYAIVDEIIIPDLDKNFSIKSILRDDNKKEILRNAMKYLAEDTKIQMSFNEKYNLLTDLGEIPGKDDNGNEFEIDLMITQKDLEQVFKPIFQKAIDICKELIKRNNLSNSDINTLLFVGGPTYSPILRKMTEEQIIKPNTSIDPMTVVAKGAALYASTIDIKGTAKKIDKSKVQLELGYDSTTVEEEVFITIKHLKDKSENSPDQIFVELIRNDKAWSSGRKSVDQTGEIIEIRLNKGIANSFEIAVFDEKGTRLESQPNEITIIQGTKVGSATLPYHIGIEVLDKYSKELIFSSVKGLEKNNSIPAKGVLTGLRTLNSLRPGMKQDTIRIPIYQGEYAAEGTRAIDNEHIYDVIITGADINSFLPENSEVNFYLDIDQSETMSVIVEFPSLNFKHQISVPSDTKTKEIEASWLESQFIKAKQSLQMLESEGYCDRNETNAILDEIKELEVRFNQGKNDYDRKKDVLDSLKRVCKKIFKIQELSKWPKTEQELKDVFKHLKEVNDQYGNDKTNDAVRQIEEGVENITKNRNIKIAREMIENIRNLDFMIMDQGMGANLEIGLLLNCNENYNMIDWSNRNRARSLIDEGIRIANTNPTKEQLRPIVMELFKLMPAGRGSGFGDDVWEGILSGGK